LKDHELHGTVFVRVLHECEMIKSAAVQLFDNEESVSVIRCAGPHHPDLLSEIMDVFHRDKYDVLHSELDTNCNGVEEHVLYVEKNSKEAATSQMRLQLRTQIDELYKRHGFGGTSKEKAYTISVRHPGPEGAQDQISPPMTPATGGKPKLSASWAPNSFQVEV